ncbi:MAG: phosphoribosylglycinamide synthetase C domain-containing protein, partial [Cyanobacteria bacterium P01_A01_bin.105]
GAPRMNARDILQNIRFLLVGFSVGSQDSTQMACCQQRLAELPPLEWASGYAACVVMAAAGYPGAYPKGMVIRGLGAIPEGTTVFHAGTRLQDGEIKATGGRVLGVTALGDTFDAALVRAYAGVDQIDFDQSYCRRDIGYRVKGGSR